MTPPGPRTPRTWIGACSGASCPEPGSAAAARLREPAAAERNHFGQPDEPPYEKIAVPTLLIAGAKDPLREPGYAIELHRRIANSELRVYEPCGHMPNLEHADRFNEDVLAFLDRHLIEGGSGP